MKMTPTPTLEERTRQNMAEVARSNMERTAARLASQKPLPDGDNPFAANDLAGMTKIYRSNPQEARRLAQMAGVTLPE